jgi:hypothetical protein
MGIRFYCPNGHKLNVKEFQAGRRGICPHCGAKVEIPTESTRPPSWQEKGQTKPASDPAASGGAEAASPSGSPQGKNDDSSELLPVENLPPQGPPVPGQEYRPQEHRPSAPTQPPAGVAPVPEPILPKPNGRPAAADPLAEAGDVVWYVRPAAGGQFGPASSEVMRSWLGENRVVADSLVWREGWPDWRQAGKVFPQLGAEQLPGALPRIAVGQDALGGVSAHHRAGPRRSHRSKQVTVFAVLVAAALVLLIVLIVVLARAFGGETQGPAGPPSAAGLSLRSAPTPPSTQVCP